jgi:CRP-like cAMP-binding protein
MPPFSFVDAEKRLRDIGRPINATSGQKLFTKGQPSHSIFLLLSGHVIIFAEGANDRRLIVRDIQPGQFFPLTVLVDDARHALSAFTVTPCKLMTFNVANVRRLMLADPSVNYLFLQIALRELRVRGQQLIDSVLLSAAGRISKWLLKTARRQRSHLRNGIRIQIDVSERLVGLATAGLSRETVSRQLGRLSRQGIIRREGNELVLLDLARLEALATGGQTLIKNKRLV